MGMDVKKRGRTPVFFSVHTQCHLYLDLSSNFVAWPYYKFLQIPLLSCYGTQLFRYFLRLCFLCLPPYARHTDIFD